MILKTKPKVKFAGPIHWNCVRSKQVVFKCSDVATFHQNVALGKMAKLLMEAQGASLHKTRQRWIEFCLLSMFCHHGHFTS